jgi:cytochrome c-type biogenesis protein CcmH/NrfG
MGHAFRKLLILSAVTLIYFPTAGRAADSWVEVRTPHFTVSSNSGAKEARRIATQFEEIREVFHSMFRTLRVDPGEPLLIIAVKNEDSLKVLLPDYWASKDHAHPAGIYVALSDESFAALRTDISGSAENPYHSLYHEYTHAVMRLNFNGLPIWLNEGLAEFYGNTVVDEKETMVGRVSPMQLNLLQRSSFIPIEQLMNADSRSPLYNESDYASILYAESWAIVHYMMLDPEASKQGYLNQYLKAWDETRDGAEAARRTFGDLKKFGSRIEEYCHQPSFYYSRQKPATRLSPNDFALRSLSPAEALVTQADFLQHMNHIPEARKMLDEALQQQPDLASIHTCIGFDKYTQYNNDDAEKEFQQAAALNPQDFRSFFYLAQIALRKSGYGPQATPQIVQNLEKVVQLNPNFAPAWAFLSVAYRQQPDTREKALDAAHKANHLEPGIMAYAVDVGNALMALDRDAEARAVSETLNRIASTPRDKAAAQSFARRLARHEENVAKKSSPGNPFPASSGDTASSQDTDEAVSPAKPDDTAPANQPAPALPDRDEGAQKMRSEEGLIRNAYCTPPGHVAIRFAILGETLRLSATDTASIKLRMAGKDSTSDAVPCSQWPGRKAKITFRTVSDPNSDGEILTIDFL